MTIRRPFPPIGRGLLVALWLTSWAAVAVHAAPPITGKLETVQGVSVLKLWGSPREQGYAHGYLLADRIIPLLEMVLQETGLAGDPARYEGLSQTILPAMFAVPPRFQEELEGMVEGIKAARGEKGIQIPTLQRDLEVRDVLMVNTFADLNAMMCSSFSAWGERTAGGELITARNLDYGLPSLQAAHLVIVYLEPGEGRQRWVSLAWPSLIGAYTAMNDQGVTISMHDSISLPTRPAPPFVPRSFVLRDALERADARDGIEQVQKVLQEHHVACGNNIHVSVPFHGQAHPAAVFEYDGQVQQAKGVTPRYGDAGAGTNTHSGKASAESGSVATTSSALPPGVLVCTNHYRARRDAIECGRYGKITARLAALAEQRQPVTPDVAREIMQDVAMRGRNLTLHTAIFLPNERVFYVALASEGRPAPLAELHRFAVVELLER